MEDLLARFTSLIVSTLILCNVHAEDKIISPIPNDIKFNAQKHKLGKALFHDKRLSKDNSVSCSSCHNLDSFGVDGLSKSKGIYGREGKRNAPSVYNLAFNESYFWDGRADDLESQIDGPIKNHAEMGSNWEEIVSKISKDKKYIELFKKIYPDKGISEKTIKDSIKEFEISLITPNSPFDQYLKGNKSALSKAQKKGFELFKSYGCISCHQGINIGGNMLQLFGVAEDLPEKTLGLDQGRFNETEDPKHKNIYRVPSLRNIDKTAPYFHDGSVDDLREAIKIMGRYQLGEDIKGQDLEDLYNFLKSLTGVPKNSK